MRHFGAEQCEQIMLSQPLDIVQTVGNRDHAHVHAPMFQLETFTGAHWCAYVLPMHACAPRH